jgi:hypothetical protein
LRGAWLGLAVAVYGLVSSMFLVTQGGGFLLVMRHLAFALPLAVTGAITVCAGMGLIHTERDATPWIVAVAGAGALMNVLPYAIVYGERMWRKLIPRAPIHGIDLRDGLLIPARAFDSAHSGWPPLTLWLGRPFTLLDLRAAYVVQFIILFALAVLATWLSVTLAARVDDRPADLRSGRPTLRWVLFGAMLAWLLTSYGFMFELERGNIDLYALVFALLAIVLTLRTRTAWLPALCLAVAINLKVYPAILVVVLLWRYRLRAVLPLVVFCGVLALSAGVGNLSAFVSGLSTTATGRTGGHSAVAFVYWLRHLPGMAHRAPPGLGPALLLLSLVLWGATLALLVRRGWSAKGAVLAAAACVPVMSTVPSISEDYKLVIFVFPLAVLGVAIATMKRAPVARWSALFLALAMEMVVLARSSRRVAPSVLGSKFVAIMLLQGLMLLVVLLLRDGRGAGADAPRLSPPDGLPAPDHPADSGSRRAVRPDNEVAGDRPNAETA